MILSETRHSDLYNLLANLGLLCTEDRRIRYEREHNGFYEELPLSFEDIERIGYFNPHIVVKPEYAGTMELWYGDRYLNPQEINWIETTHGLYGVMPEKFDPSVPVRCHRNPSIVYRYSNVVEDDADDGREFPYAHTVLIDANDIKYASIPNLRHAAFYISNNQICLPEVTEIDDHTLRFRAPYAKDIDFFICSNIATVVQARAGIGTYVDQPHSNRTYHDLVVDNTEDYPIDTRFYPIVKVDKDCIIRVYSTSYSHLEYPEVSRLILYPEFMNITDPYNCDNEYLNSLEPIDDMIGPDDSDDVILEKFGRIAACFYRMWEKLPSNGNMQSDFVICDNSSFTDPYFNQVEVHLYDTTVTKILCRAPFEEMRDLLFYKGALFSDYIVRSMRYTTEGIWVENRESGVPYYLIDPGYELDQFTLIKFNTAEDSTIMNLGDYINEENILRLHLKVNRFYRNLMILRQQILPAEHDNQVRVSTVPPLTHDDHLWFELLINAVPEMFETKAIEQIDLAGLDHTKVPDGIKAGAYALDLDVEGGEPSYTNILMTYFNLTRGQRKMLALQYPDPVDDPRVKEYDALKIGQIDGTEKLNDVILEDTTAEHTTQEIAYEYGQPDNPGQEGHVEGNLYVQLPEREPEPGEENIDITEIHSGPYAPPTGDIHHIWLESGEKDQDIPESGSLDGVTDRLMLVNDPDMIQDKKTGDYAMDSIDDTLTPGEEGEIDIDLENMTSGQAPVDPNSDISYRSVEDDIDELFDGVNEDTPDEVELDLFGSISEAVAKGVTIQQIMDPKYGQIALDDISFTDSDTGETTSIGDIKSMSMEDKINTVIKYITSDTTPESVDVGDMWFNYLSDKSEELLNTIVYRILLTKSVIDIAGAKVGDLALEGENLPEGEEESLAYGKYLKWAKEHQILIQPLEYDADGNVKPDWATVYKNNLRYIFNIYEPDNVHEGDLWLAIPAVTLKEYIADVISKTLYEAGYEMPEGYRDSIYASMVFDYIPRDTGTDGVGEIWQQLMDESLHPVHEGAEPPDTTGLRENDIWYEFLDTIDGRVAYSDPNTMIIRMDEHLLAVNFADDNITTFAFDDILINFKGKLGVRYLSILADLINSKVIDLSEVNVFYKRLITTKDHLDPGLARLYTGTSHVVATAKVDTTDFSILYSSNIGRFSMNYAADDTTNREREAAYRMVIDLANRNFMYLTGRMILFVNGRYVPTAQIRETEIGKLELLNFDELISTVDILYSKKDQHLIDLKLKAVQYWQYDEHSSSIQEPGKNFGKMEPIDIHDSTYRGFYDVLINEYIINGKLMRILRYLEDHPEEAHDFKLDMVRKFHRISDTEISGIPEDEARIIISGNSGDNPAYTIQ